jgi:hypothetical protein
MTMNPKTIVALAGDRNLLFTVWPTAGGTTVPTSGTRSSSNPTVASVVSTTPSAAGFPRGRVNALAPGFSEISYASGSMTASGRVEVIRTSGSPPAPEPTPDDSASSAFSGSPIERISNADSTLTADGGETLVLFYPEPTNVTVLENPSEGFELATDSGLVVTGEPRALEIT